MRKSDFPIQAPRGFKDILPDDQKYWQFVFDVARDKCQGFGLLKIDLPLVEYRDIFSRSIGQTSDIVEKEMFLVSRASIDAPDPEEDISRPMVLRPEGTAGVIRAYLERGMETWPQPVKLYYWGPMFRADRPQKGRFRQFWQFGIEIINADDAYTDALTILFSWQFFQALGLQKGIILELNTIGCANCRPKIHKKLVSYYETYQSVLCDDCQRRLITNPLRVIDCKNEKCQKLARGAPQIIDQICPECNQHFKSVLDYLDDLAIPYELNPQLVRGLDYYTRTIFEVRDTKDTSRQNSLGGGGRYDNLVPLLGGKKTPAIGVSFGIERIIAKIKEENIEIIEKGYGQILISQLGEKAKRKALSLMMQLTDAGYKTGIVFGKEGLKSQLKAADKMAVKIVLIIGQKEVQEKTILVRDMEEGNQEIIEEKELFAFLKKKLGS